MPVDAVRNWRLTGRAAFQPMPSGFLRGRERLVVRVEEETESHGRRFLAWRDATTADLAEPALRWLVNGGGE